jgi:hypothetical protein
MAITGRKRLLELVESPERELALRCDYRRMRDFSRHCGIVSALTKGSDTIRQMWGEIVHLKGTVIARINNYQR